MPMMDSRRRSTNPRHDQEPLVYSPQSVLYAMDRFSSAVGAMEHSVLVPCRLQDVSDPQMGDLHAAYKLLTKTKVELLFGEDGPTMLHQKPGKNSRLAQNGNHAASAAGESDSSVDQNGNLADPTALDPAMIKLHNNLNQNLKNLYGILNQMTDAANRVTTLYLKEVGGH